MALQGMDVEVHDIDLQTDEAGAYAIENQFVEYSVTPVRYFESERMRSHLGGLAIDGIQVEIIGAVQKRGEEQAWEEPVELGQVRRWIEFDGMHIPVLSLEYEYQAYRRMGRLDKAQMLKEWLSRHNHAGDPANGL